jgi:hypothetical protein
MTQEIEPEVLAVLRDALTGDTGLTRRLALLAPTKKLARMLGGEGASLIETRFCSSDMPRRGLLSHCSRETRLAQAQEQGDSCYATTTLPS